MKEKKKLERVEWFDSRWYKIETQDPADEAKKVVDYFPSTTTILGASAKPWLARWRGQVGNREADTIMFEAQARGVRIHEAWEVLTSGGVVIFNPWESEKFSAERIQELEAEHMGLVYQMRNQEEMFQAWKLDQWLKAVKPVEIYNEQNVYSRTKRRAGTLDNIALIEAGSYEINGSEKVKLERGLYIGDLKSGANVDDDAFLQIADYRASFEEMAASGVDWARELVEKYGPVKGGFILHTGAKTKKGVPGLATHFVDREQMTRDLNDVDHVHAVWLRKNKDLKPEVFDFPAIVGMGVQDDKKEE